MELILESLFNSVAIGSVLLVAALGLAIVFGLMGVINLAHGELMMVGAYSTYVTQLIFKLPILKPFYDIYVLIAIIIAFIVSGTVGILLERTVIRRLYGSPLETLLATWGVSLILQQFVRSVPLAYATGCVITIFISLLFSTVIPQNLLQGNRRKLIKTGALGTSAAAGVLTASALASLVSKLSRASSRNVDVTAPPWMRGGVDVLGMTFPKTRLLIIVITIISVVAVSIFLNKSVWGVRIRAVTQNRDMSECLGISTESVDVITFGIGSGLAGVAGVAVSLLGSVGPNVGGNYIVGCFMVVVLGGVGNLLGTVIASFSIGLMTDLIGAGRLLTIWPNMPQPLASTVDFFSTTSMARVMIFALIVGFLQYRPAGLFPQKGRMVES